MARLAVITHTYDNFRGRKPLLGSLAAHWAGAGHAIDVIEGLGDWPNADAAIIHVDLSVVPEAYRAAAKRYPIVLNGNATDIRKTRVSRNLLKRGDDWTGPVVVKTDLNFSGIPERFALECFRRDGKTPDLAPVPLASTDKPYPILRSIDAVPDAIWNNPGLVVERFLPERDGQGFWMRAWVFFGGRERCTRYCGTHPIVKTSNIIAREPAPVPDELRAERERLGFDYGKFDFVVREGRAILLDANRTPSAPPASSAIDASNADLASGLAALLRKFS
ncbi:MAG TPA: hypothetical protein VFI32_02065 [Rhodanobacteraceae bacterium]|nr:hypothetical protein [Rhodanobacteraceae bacterium]